MRRRRALAVGVAVPCLLALAGCGRGAAAPPPDQPPAPIVVRLTSADHKITLDPGRDYVLRAPRAGISPPGGLVVEGGHDVTWRGGTITVHTPADAGVKNAGRGLYLLRQTGTVRLQRLHLRGPGLSEGIDIAAPRATVAIADLVVDRVHRPPGLRTHPDVIQTWSGPRRLLVDGLSAVTDYQGLFLVPEAYGPVTLGRWSLRDVEIAGTRRAGYLLWRPHDLAVDLRGVYLRWNSRRPLDRTVWPNARAWRGVQRGRAPRALAAAAGAGGSR